MAPSTVHVSRTCDCRPVVFDLGSGHPCCAACGRAFMHHPSLADRRVAARALQHITRALHAVAPIADDERREDIERSLLDAATRIGRLKHGLPAPPRKASP